MLTLDTFQARPLCGYKSLMKFPCFIAAEDFQLPVSTTERGGVSRHRLTSATGQRLRLPLQILLAPHFASSLGRFPLWFTVLPLQHTSRLTRIPLLQLSCHYSFPASGKQFIFFAYLGPLSLVQSSSISSQVSWRCLLALQQSSCSQLLGILRGAQCLKLGAGFGLRLQAPSRVGGLFHTSRIWHSCSSIPI